MKNFFSTLFFVIILAPSVAQAAISFVGSAEGGAANNADPTADLTTITGLAENDLVIAACGIGDGDAVNLNVTMNSVGYTGINDLFIDDTHETNFEVFYKFMSSTPDTSAVCEGSTGGNDAGTAIVVMAFRGVDTTTPFDVASTSATAINDPDADPPSIDWSTTGVWTVIAAASANALGNSCTSDAYLFPTGYTTDQIECAGNDTVDISVGMGYNSAPADPEDPGIVDHNGTDSTNNSWAAFTMALRPAVAVAPTVITNDAGSVGVSSATLTGTISATGGANATVRGFAWGTNSGLSGSDTSTTTNSGDFGTGNFSQSVINLKAGITYYLRAYATNSAGNGYGTTTNFTTGTDNTPSRKIRLFQSSSIKIFNGRIILR